MNGLRFSVHAVTDTGRVREANEDSHFAGSKVFAVADGMGGHVAGEVASRKAIEPVEELDRSDFASDADAQSALVSAITTANQQVVEDAAADPNLTGMGTTLTVVMVRDGRLYLAHVGDSRAYLLRRGEQMSQLTTDHTLVEQLISEGRLARDQAATHPQRSVITRAIGIERDIEVDSFSPLELRPGDQVILCSDGLIDAPVADEEIAAILEAEPDGDTAARQLIAKANERGGRDNITVVLLRMHGDREAPGAAVAPAERTEAVSDEDDTARLGAPVPRAPVRTSEGAHPIRTRQESGTDVDWADRMGRYGDEQGADGTPPRRRRGRLLAVLLGVVVLIGLLGLGGYALLARAYFVGDDGGMITIYNGLPQNIAGLPLYWERESTDLTTDDLPDFQAERVRAGQPVPTLADARATVERYRESIAEAEDDPDDRDAQASPSPDPSPSPSPSPDPTGAETGPATGTSPDPTS